MEADIIRIFDTLSLYINCNFDSDGINTKDIVLMQAFFTKTQLDWSLDIELKKLSFLFKISLDLKVVWVKKTSCLACL